MIRLSIGIEHIDDILADIDQALTAALDQRVLTAKRERRSLQCNQEFAMPVLVNYRYPGPERRSGLNWPGTGTAGSCASRDGFRIRESFARCQISNSLAEEVHGTLHEPARPDDLPTPPVVGLWPENRNERVESRLSAQRASNIPILNPSGDAGEPAVPVPLRIGLVKTSVGQGARASVSHCLRKQRGHLVHVTPTLAEVEQKSTARRGRLY